MTTQEKTEKEAIAHLKTMNKADLLKFTTQNVGKIIGTVSSDHELRDELEEAKEDRRRLREQLKEKNEQYQSVVQHQVRTKTAADPQLDPNQINGFLVPDHERSKAKGVQIISTKGQTKAHLNFKYTKPVTFEHEGQTITKDVEVNETRKIFMQIGQSSRGFWFSGYIFQDDEAKDVTNFFNIKTNASTTDMDFREDDNGNQIPNETEQQYRNQKELDASKN